MEPEGIEKSPIRTNLANVLVKVPRLALSQCRGRGFESHHLPPRTLTASASSLVANVSVSKWVTVPARSWAGATARAVNRPSEGTVRTSARSTRLSSTEIAQLPELDRGEGLWRIGERSFMVRHTCTPGELVLFDTDFRMETFR
jgi:hypothetical protein